MTQDINNNKHYIADEGKVFQRIHNGFTEMAEPVTYGTELFLGQIIVDNNGNKLEQPIDDSIKYYTEVDKPEEEPVTEEPVAE